MRARKRKLRDESFPEMIKGSVNLVTWRISQPIVVAFLCLIVVVMSSLLGTMAHHKLIQEDLNAELIELKAHLNKEKVKLLEYQKRHRVMDAMFFITSGKMDTNTIVKTSHQLFQMSNSMGFDPLLILALVGVESRGNPRAVGRYRSGKESGALGLMQIKKSTAGWLANKLGHENFQGGELIHADKNILYGTLYLMDLVQKYESLPLGVMAYNVGPGALNKYLKHNRKKLPKRYLNRMLSNYNDLVEKFGNEPS